MLRAILRARADETTVAWREALEHELALQGMLAGFLLIACDLGRAWLHLRDRAAPRRRDARLRSAPEHWARDGITVTYYV